MHIFRAAAQDTFAILRYIEKEESLPGSTKCV